MNKKTPHFFVLGIPKEEDRCQNAVYFVRSTLGVAMYVTDSRKKIFPVASSDIKSPEETLDIRLDGQTISIDINPSVLEDLNSFLTNSPKKIIINSNLSSTIPVQTFCRASLNQLDPPVTLGRGDIPFFNVIYGEDLVVFTLNSMLVNRSFGLDEPNIQTSNIQIISRTALSTNSLDETTTQYIDVIANVSENDNIWERVNLHDYNVQPLFEGFSVFRAEVQGEEKEWLYRGVSGDVGLNGYQTQEADFKLLVKNEFTTPTLQQVLDADGNFVYAEFPSGTYIEDENGSFSIQLQDKFITFTLDGALKIDADFLVLKDSNASLEGRALVVQADGSVDWEDVSVDLSDYYTKTEIDSIINDLPVGYDSTDFNADFEQKTTDDLNEGLLNLYATGDEFQLSTDTLDDILEGNANKHFTSEKETKLNGIEAEAQKNVQSDYSQTDENADDYIKNMPKPKFLTVPISNELEADNVMGNYYNLTAPTDQFSFTLVNKKAGAFVVVRVNANTLGSPDSVQIDGNTTGRKSSVDQWFDNQDMDLKIFVRNDLSVEWEYFRTNY